MINKLKQYLLHESRIVNTDPINYEEFVRDYYKKKELNQFLYDLMENNVPCVLSTTSGWKLYSLTDPIFYAYFEEFIYSLKDATTDFGYPLAFVNKKTYEKYLFLPDALYFTGDRKSDKTLDEVFEDEPIIKSFMIEKTCSLMFLEDIGENLTKKNIELVIQNCLDQHRLKAYLFNSLMLSTSYPEFFTQKMLFNCKEFAVEDRSLQSDLNDLLNNLDLLNNEESK